MNPISQYKGIDKGFSESFFIQKITNIYYRFKVNFSDKNPEEIEAYIFPDFYERLTNSLSGMIESRNLLYTERITVLDASISGFEQRDGFDYIHAVLRTREVEYYINPDTKAYLSGNKTEQFRNAEVVFCRQSGLQTETVKNMNSHTCPYCGAPSNLNRTAKCEYCGRILNTDCFDWQICSVTVH